MTDHPTRSRTADATLRAAVERSQCGGTTVDRAWRRFRDELDTRLVARFGPSFAERDGGVDADPDILADLALQRALCAF